MFAQKKRHGAKTDAAQDTANVAQGFARRQAVKEKEHYPNHDNQHGEPVFTGCALLQKPGAKEGYIYRCRILQQDSGTAVVILVAATKVITVQA